MSERDSKEDEHDELGDEEEEESSPAPRAKAKASRRTSSAAGKRVATSSAAPGMIASSRAIAIGVVALALGGALGWVAQIQKTKAALRADIAAAPVASGVPAGACGAWQSKICASSGPQSAACQQAKGATSLLLSSTCEVALGTMPETLAKLKAARASCDKLVGKLCADLPPGSKACDLVKERTPSFPSERCDQMLGSYDKVIAELKQIDAQGAMPMQGAQRMQPGGMGPGGMPHITMPPGVSMPGPSKP
ncbi:MAG: hypothetical protein WDO69_31795 [Pseudomonadota bacterium]